MRSTRAIVLLSALAGCTTEAPELATVAANVEVPLRAPVVATATGPGVPLPGTLAGSYQTTGDGSASYTIPIEVPPGRAGVQPSLALTYTSRGRDGLAGVGWSITGLSQLTRCGSNFFHDRKTQPVRLDGSDAFCLDGARLLRISAVGASVSAPHCPASTSNVEYRTEPDRFRRIVMCGSDGYGPLSWMIYDRNGTATMLGSDPTSRLETWTPLIDGNGNPGAYTARRVGWLADRVEDVAGNFMVFTYGKDAANDRLEWWPDRIDYTQFKRAVGGPVSGTRRVTFEYESRPDTTSTFLRGVELKQTRRLRYITMTAPDAPEQVAAGTPLTFVRRYQLGYITSAATQRSLLDSVTLCDGLGECLRPTRLSYATAAPSFVSSLLPGDTFAVDFMTLDANGDGRDDLFTDGRVALATGTSTAPSFAASVATGFSYTGFRMPVPYDTGDHKVDLVGAGCSLWQCASGGGRPCPLNDDYCAAPTIEIGQSRGDGTFAPSPSIPACAGSACASPFYGIGDLNGDLRPDAVSSFAYQLSLSSGTPAASLANPLGHGFVVDWPWHFADIDGDGALDVLWPRSGGYDAIHVRGAPGATTVDATPTNLTLGQDGCDLLADVNGDGLADAVDLQTGAQVRLNRGDGRFTTAVAWSSTGVPACSQFAVTEFPQLGYKQAGVYPVDYNHDGLQDLLILRPSASAAESARLLRSTGSSFVLVTLPFTFTIGGKTCSYANVPNLYASPLDINADGLFDVLFKCTGGTAPQWGLVRQTAPASSTTGGHPDVLTEIRDGFDAVVRRVDYKLTTDPSVYTGQVWNAIDWRQPLLVVASEWADTGTGAVVELARHTYAGGALSGDSEGWLGFTSHTTLDPRSGATRRVTFATEGDLPGAAAGTAPLRRSLGGYLGGRAFHPFIGHVVEDQTTVVAGGHTLVSRTRTVPEAVAVEYPSGADNYFVFDRQVTTEAFEDSTSLSKSVTTTTVDTCGAPTFESVDRAPGAATARRQDVRTTHAPANPDYNVGTVRYCDLGARWIDFVAQRTVTSWAGTDSATRTTQYVAEPDGTGRVKDTIVQPGSGPDDMLCTRVVARDTYGTPVEVDVTPWTCTRTTTGAPERLTRTTRTVLDTVRWNSADVYEGIYPTQATNPLGHVSKQYVHSGLGVTYGTVDANTATTAARFDGFGRSLRTDRPDGLAALPSRDATDTAYLDPAATAAAPCLGDGYTAASFRLVERTTGTDGTESLQCRDRLGRVARTASKKMFGGYAYVDTTYVSNHPDRVYQTTRPHALGQPTVLAARYAYDAAGRVTSVTAARPEDPTMPVVTTMTYSGRTVDTCEAGRVRRRKTTAAFGPIESTAIFPDATTCTTGTAATTMFSYGPFDTMILVVDPIGNYVNQTYDARGRRIQIVDKDVGVVNTKYTAFGEVREETNGNNQKTTIVHDALGRVTRRTVSGESDDVFTYDPAGARGQLATSTRGTVVRSLGYDALARPVTGSVTIDGTTYDTTTAYDDQGRVALTSTAAIAGLGRIKLRYQYRVGRLELIELGRASATCTSDGQCQAGETCRSSLGSVCGRTAWQALATDDESRVTDERYASGLRASQHWKGGVIDQLRVYSPTADVLRLAYHYFDNGSLSSRVDELNGATESFTYDGVDRLRTATVTGQPAATYDYDVLGNLTYASDTRPTAACTQGAYLDYTRTTPWSAVGPHALTGLRCKGTAYTAAFRYDTAGQNLSGLDAADAFAWTSFGKLAQSSSVDDSWQFTYDADHERVMKRQTWSRTTPLPAYPWTKIIFAGALERRFKPGGEQDRLDIPAGRAPLQLVWDWNGTSGTLKLQYGHTDLLGSPVLITDGTTGAVGERRGFDVWGNPRGADLVSTAPSPSVTNLGFTGQHVDLGVATGAGAGFGFVDMRGRIYNPLLKRFWSPDPVVQAPTYGPSWNRYAYGFGNPLKFIDPSGYEASLFQGIANMFAMGDGRDWFDSAEGSARDALRSWLRLLEDSQGRVVVLPLEQAEIAAGAESQSNVSATEVTHPYRPSLPGIVPYASHSCESFACGVLVNGPLGLWNLVSGIVGTPFHGLREAEQIGADFLVEHHIANSDEEAHFQIGMLTGTGFIAESVQALRLRSALQPLRPLGRGSSANGIDRWQPRNLREQLAVEEAMQQPASGIQAAGPLGDPRWHARDGWIKKQQTIDPGGREGPITVHYTFNPQTGQVDDFKIVERALVDPKPDPISATGQRPR